MIVPGESFEQLQQALGWRFRAPGLLLEALTHSSFANEHPDAGPHNERLEFLGDAVLGLIAARILFDKVAAREGELSRRRARVVRTEAFAAQAEQLNLGACLRLGEGQKRAVGGDRHLLENAFEALAAAVFCDGGYAAAEQCFAPRLANAIATATSTLDWKSELQEACHKRGLPPPVYTVVAVNGPDHARSYACLVRVGEGTQGAGEASNKKSAEQLCAKDALDKLESA